MKVREKLRESGAEDRTLLGAALKKTLETARNTLGDFQDELSMFLERKSRRLLQAILKCSS